MPLRRLRWFVLLCLLLPSLAFAGAPKNCVTADEASRMLDKDVCITAHVYDVVELSNGTRFLDVCPPEVSDDSCRFTIVSLRQDRAEVGELLQFKSRDIRIRGHIQSMQGRAAMFLSHERQFNGGPPKFRPNPRLARGFNAAQDRPPVSDPNLRSHGSHRAFMSTLNQESRTAK